MADESLSPFAPPKANLEGVVAGPEVQLAERGTRLAAVLLDGLIFIPVVLPFAVGAFLAAPKGGAASSEPGAAVIAMMALGGLAMVGLAIYQLAVLSTRGQTLGKRWMKIRVVKLDGSNPGFVGAVLLRAVVGGVISGIPYLGWLYSLVDILFIFREDRRCIHDLIASTRVVVA